MKTTTTLSADRIATLERELLADVDRLGATTRLAGELELAIARGLKRRGIVTVELLSVRFEGRRQYAIRRAESSATPSPTVDAWADYMARVRNAAARTAWSAPYRGPES